VPLGERCKGKLNWHTSTKRQRVGLRQPRLLTRWRFVLVFQKFQPRKNASQSSPYGAALRTIRLRTQPIQPPRTDILANFGRYQFLQGATLGYL
jgi:hypothetical protein